MDVSISRKCLSIASGIELFMGTLLFIICIAGLVLGIGQALDPSFAQNFLGKYDGLSFALAGISAGVTAVISFVYAHFEIAAAADPLKIMPVRYLSVMAIAVRTLALLLALRLHMEVLDELVDCIFLAAAVAVFIASGSICRKLGTCKPVLQ